MIFQLKTLLKIAFFLCLIFISTTSLKAQSCLPNGITFLNQESIDDFSTNYPGCTIIEGSVTISDLYENITNLNGLSQIEEIQGALEIIYSHNLVNLLGLNNLHTVDVGINLTENNNLITLQGLENLTSIGTLRIDNNDNLVSISDLNLIQVSDAISVSYNDNLTSLNGLENITIIDYLLIDNNDSLTNLSGLDGLTVINSGFDILRNDGLINLSGLDALTNTNYSLISENGSLQTLNGLESLTTINHFYIQQNNQLFDISGLSSLNEFNGVNAVFAIILNNMLTSLNGLEGLTAIHGELRIGGNTQLDNIDGVRNVDAETITNLYITNNTTLSECAVLSICEHLDIDPQNTFISGNQVGCQNQQEVEAACLLNTEENQIAELKIYPNPTNNTFEISGLKQCTIEIIDSQGRTVKQMASNENNYSISELSSGIYFVKITSEKTSITKQLIKT